MANQPKKYRKFVATAATAASSSICSSTSCKLQHHFQIQQVTHTKQQSTLYLMLALSQDTQMAHSNLTKR